MHQAQGVCQRRRAVGDADLMCHRIADGLQGDEGLFAEMAQEVRLGDHAGHLAQLVHGNQMAHALPLHAGMRFEHVDGNRHGQHRRTHGFGDGVPDRQALFGQQRDGIALGENSTGSPLVVDHHDATYPVARHGVQHFAHRSLATAGDHVRGQDRLEGKCAHDS